jgi:sugar lactone lactonase YvrE
MAILLFLVLAAVGCNDKGTVVDMPDPGEELDGMLYTVAGQPGEGANDGDGGPAKDAYLFWPVDTEPIEATGELLVIDWNNHRIRRIDADGIIHPFIGSGFLGDDRHGNALDMDFNHPTDVKLGPDGNWWVAAYHNWCFKVIDPTMMFVEAIGDTARGYRGDWPENNGSIDAGAKPRFDLPSTLVWDAQGLLYFMDQGNARIRKVDLTTRQIFVFAGGTRGSLDGVGTQAQFAFPGGTTAGIGERAGMDISPDKQDIYLCDTESHKIRKLNIATQMVTTIAGTGTPGWSGDGGPALSAELNFPTDITCTAEGDLYIADTHNHVIRKIDMETGIITTVAGTASIGYSPDGTPAREAKFYQPLGVSYNNRTKTLFIADQYNFQIRKVINP